MAWQHVNCEDISIPATKALLAFGGMSQRCRRCGLRRFFEHAPDRGVRLRARRCEFHDLVLQQPQRPAAHPFGSLEHARAMTWLPSRHRRSQRLVGSCRVLRLNTPSKPSSTDPLRMGLPLGRGEHVGCPSVEGGALLGGPVVALIDPGVSARLPLYSCQSRTTS